MVCPEIPTFQIPRIRMPGGAVLVTVPAQAVPDPSSMARIALGQASAALAPVLGILRIVDALVAVKGLVEALPEAIASFNPKKIADASAALVSKIDVVAQQIPQIAVPVLALDLLALLDLAAAGLLAELDGLVEAQARADAAAAAAAELVGEAAAALAEEAGCAAQLVQDQLAALEVGNAGLTGMVSVLNVLSGLVSIQALPDLGALGSDLDESRAQVQAFRSAIGTVRDAIPL